MVPKIIFEYRSRFMKSQKMTLYPLQKLSSTRLLIFYQSANDQLSLERYSAMNIENDI